MDKYYGCNIVDSVVTYVPRKAVRVKRRGRGALARWITAIIAVGAVCAAVFLPLPQLETVRGVMRDVIFYDVFGRTDIGVSYIFRSLFGA